MDQTVAHSGHSSAVIRSASTSVKGEADFAKLFQCIGAGPFIGHRVRYGGFLKTAGVSNGWAGLWLRVEDENRGTLAFDNMRDRAPHGTTAWRQFGAVAEVPPGAAQVCYGFHLVGPGEVWVDDLAFGVSAS